MTAGLSAYSHLELTPPLQLKSLGIEGPRLVLIKEGRILLIEEPQILRNLKSNF